MSVQRGLMKTIKLNHNKITLVDDADFVRFGKTHWYLSAGEYAYRMVRYGKRKLNKRKLIWLHREVNNTPEKYLTDHINGNRLDNRSSNLRTVTKQQNSWHQTRLNANNKSGFRGVYWDKKRIKWRATINLNNKQIFIGRYVDKREAVKAYNSKAIELFGVYV